MKYDRDRLLEIIRRDALQFGDFTLASGQKSHYYLDCRQVTLSAEGAAIVGAGVLDAMGDEPFDAIGGMTLGADPIVAAVLTLAGMQGRSLRGFLTRKQAKEHGAGKLVEGPLRPGDRVVIVEDTTTTGGSVLQTIAAIEPFHCKVARVVTVMDRIAGAGTALAAQGIEFSALLTVRDLGLS